MPATMCPIFLACLSLLLPPSFLLVSFSVRLLHRFTFAFLSVSPSHVHFIIKRSEFIYMYVHVLYIYVRLASVIHIVLRQNYRQVLPLTPFSASRFASLTFIYFFITGTTETRQ